MSDSSLPQQCQSITRDDPLGANAPDYSEFSEIPAALPSVSADGGIIEIRDPNIDVPDLMDRIRRNSIVRRPLPPSAAALGRVRMARQRKKLIASLKELKSRVRDYGVVESHKAGWTAKIDLFIKRAIRKFIKRHILQQHRVHLKLHTVLGQLIQYLEEEDRSLRACIDQAERQWQQRSDE